MSTQSWMWVGFTIFVLGMLALDLGVFNRRAHVVRPREAALWSLAWVSLATLFGVGVYLRLGPEPGLQFAAGYLVELALSVDNLFVFILLFSYFRVPQELQHRVLFWGILGALIMRAAMIAAGAALLNRFHWIVFVFGAFLVITGVRMAFQSEVEIDPEHNPVLRIVRRLLPVTAGFRGQHFFVREAPAPATSAAGTSAAGTSAPGASPRLFATPLFIVLVLVETTDLVFAVDSIPAIFGVTTDPFLVYTSNVFAILGLRSLYFLLSGVMSKFHYLRFGLAAVLSFVGVKMLLSEVIHVSTGVSLGVIAALLGGSVVASMLRPATPDIAEVEGDRDLEDLGITPDAERRDAVSETTP